MATSQQNAIAAIVRKGLEDWQARVRTRPGANIADIRKLPSLRPGPTMRQRQATEQLVYEKTQKIKSMQQDLDNAFISNPILDLAQAKAAGMGGVGTHEAFTRSLPYAFNYSGSPLDYRISAAVDKHLQALEARPKGTEPLTWANMPPPIYGPALDRFSMFKETKTPPGTILERMLLNNGHVLGPHIVGSSPRLGEANYKVNPMGELLYGNNRPPFPEIAANYIQSLYRRSTLGRPLSYQETMQVPHVPVLEMTTLRSPFSRPYPKSISPLMQLLLSTNIKGPLLKDTILPWQPGAGARRIPATKTVLSTELLRLGLKPEIAFLSPEGTVIRHPITNDVLQKGPHGRWHRLSGFGLLEGE